MVGLNGFSEIWIHIFMKSDVVRAGQQVTQDQNAMVTNFKTYVRLLRYLKGLTGAFGLSLVGFLIFAGSQPMLAKLMQEIIDAIDKKDTSARWVLPFLAVGIFLIRGIGSFLGTYYNEFVGASVIRRVKNELFEHLTVLPAEFYNEMSQGQILHRLNSGVHQIQDAVTNALKILVREGLTVICLLVYVFYLNWKLSLVFLLISPILALIVSTSTSKLKKITKKNEWIAGKLLQVSKELISNYAVVRGFGAEEYEKKRYADALNRAFSAQLKMRRIASIFGPLSQFMVALAVATIIFLLLNPIFLNNSSPGDLVGYLTAVALLPKSLQQLSGVNSIIQRGLVGAELVFNLMDVPPEKDEGTYEPQEIKGALEVRHLNFKYSVNSRNVLNDICFQVNPGEMVALVGRSGSGKSTLASLIYRHYSIADGQIFLDGIDVNQYRLTNLRKHVAAVSQNISLFDDTVRNNVAYGDTGYTDEQITKALISAHAQDFISELPNGLDSVIGENGTKLSGGQRQRLSLARAFLKDSSFLILDEATSALDNESETIVTKAIEQLASTRTCLVIAHRLSTIMRADRLLVMNNGEIVESGTHQELLAKGGYYADLYNADYGK